MVNRILAFTLLLVVSACAPGTSLDGEWVATTTDESPWTCLGAEYTVGDGSLLRIASTFGGYRVLRVEGMDTWTAPLVFAGSAEEDDRWELGGSSRGPGIVLELEGDRLSGSFECSSGINTFSADPVESTLASQHARGLEGSWLITAREAEMDEGCSVGEAGDLRRYALAWLTPGGEGVATFGGYAGDFEDRHFDRVTDTLELHAAFDPPSGLGEFLDAERCEGERWQLQRLNLDLEGQ